ncbi:hypothetical protein [Nocardia sp. NPDC020380]
MRLFRRRKQRDSPEFSLKRSAGETVAEGIFELAIRGVVGVIKAVLHGL